MQTKSKKKKSKTNVLPFTQIAAAATGSGLICLFGLDEIGRVWMRTAPSRGDGWFLVPREIDPRSDVK